MSQRRRCFLPDQTFQRLERSQIQASDTRFPSSQLWKRENYIVMERNMDLLILTIVSLLTTASFQATISVQYDVTNDAVGTPGGTVFDNKIGIDYTKQVLADASSFIWTTFQQSEGDRKDVQVITLTVTVFSDSMNGVVAITSGDRINVSAGSLASDSGDVKTGFTGVVYHETTHVWQWGGPSGVIEGIADFVRLKAGLAPPNWPARGTGEKWDEGYAVTAYFLDYCNGLKDGFVAELNAKMKEGYSDDYFVQLLGKPVDQLLWQPQ